MSAALAISEKAVLIVDDMKTIRVKLKQICTQMGIATVYEAADGAQALEILKTMSVDLVLSDWNMPNMTGIELIQEVRKMEKFADLPVIFITAEDQKENILKSIMSGVTDYIVKPFPDAIVKQKIFSVFKLPPPRD